jgi:hypothetical protein
LDSSFLKFAKFIFFFGTIITFELFESLGDVEFVLFELQCSKENWKDGVKSYYILEISY